MIGSRVTRRYAKALFELSEERKILDQVERDLRAILMSLKTSSEFSELLVSPVIQTSDKKKTFEKLFQPSLHPLTFDFMMLLLDKNRVEYLFGIIDYFMKYLDESRGIIRGRLFSAHPFSSDQKDALIKQLEKHTGKKILLDEEQDDSLIAGFVVRLEDRVIDTSIKNQLNKMRQNLIGA